MAISPLAISVSCGSKATGMYNPFHLTGNQAKKSDDTDASEVANVLICWSYTMSVVTLYSKICRFSMFQVS